MMTPLPTPTSPQRKTTSSKPTAAPPAARAAARSGAREPYADWRKLSTSDHTYYMSTAHVADSDGDVHEYFSPYDTPHDAFITFMNVVEDLAARIAAADESHGDDA